MSDTGKDRAGVQDGRRGFLKGMLLMGGAMAAGTVAGRAVAGGEEQTVRAAPPTEAQGYRVTQHIRDYYRTASL